MGKPLMLPQFRISSCDLASNVACFFEHSSILGETRQGQIRQAALACTQYLAGPPQAQIHLGYFKAIAGAHQHLKPLAG